MDKLKTLKIWKKIEKEKEKNQQKINRRRTKENCRTAIQNYNFRTFKNCLVTFSNQKLLKSITCTILKWCRTSSYMTLSTKEFWCKLTRKYPLMPNLLCCKSSSISLGLLDLVNQGSSKGKFLRDLNRDFSADSSFICLISSGSVMISQPCLLMSKGTKSGSSSSS